VLDTNRLITEAAGYLQLGLLQEAEVLLNQVPESEPEGYLVAQMLSCRYTSMDSLSD
jgi:hypothetical protein